MHIVKLSPRGHIRSIVTRPKGAWRWQDAYAVAYHALSTTRTGRTILRTTDRSDKLARTRYTRGIFADVEAHGGRCALHNTEVRATGTDDYGNTFYVV